MAMSPAVTSPLGGGSQSGGGCDGAVHHGDAQGAEPVTCDREAVTGTRGARPPVAAAGAFNGEQLAAPEASCSRDELLHRRIEALVRAANERALPCNRGAGRARAARPARSGTGDFVR